MTHKFVEVFGQLLKDVYGIKQFVRISIFVNLILFITALFGLCSATTGIIFIVNNGELLLRSQELLGLGLLRPLQALEFRFKFGQLNRFASGLADPPEEIRNC